MRACLTCGKPCQGPRCPQHWATNGYATAHWQAIRQARLQFDHGLCTLNHAGCTIHATTVHLDPACNGDHSLATLDNTRSACARCHGIEDGPRTNLYPATSTA